MPDPGGRLIGRTISHYRVIASLGAGGMGVVYRGEDVRLGRPVAIKFVADDFAHDTQAVARLRAEARAASALNHPNICTIHDIGTDDDGRPFIVMELIEGQTLRDRLARGRLKIHELVDFGIQIADALQAAHSAGILHRDIKPANIFVNPRGHVKLLDFGLAKLTTVQAGAETATIESAAMTAAGTTLGTVSYMSPEQAAGEDLDGRTDLFSLGVVLYECATARLPFEGRTTALILSAILNRAPAPPSTLNHDLPARLQEIILTCLEKDRELRYQNAADLRADLKRVRRDLESGRMQTAATSAATRPETAAAVTDAARVTPASTIGTTSARAAASTPPARSRVPALAGGVVAVAAVIALGAYALRHDGGPPPSTESATAMTPAATSAAASTSAGAGDAIRSRLALAQSNLASGNYRAAQAYAAEVLAADPDNSAAADIRQKTTAALQRFEDSAAEARQKLASGDVQGAARALTVARDIDPTSPVISELSAALAQRVRESAATTASRPTRSNGQASPAASAASPDTRQTSQMAAAPPAPPAVPAPDSTQPPARPPAAAPATPPAVQAPAAPEPAAAAERLPPTRPSPAPPEPATDHAATAPPVAPADDEAAVRRVIASYARAIESKDLALFRSVKPNLSREEERRLQDGFRAVTSQQVRLTLTAVNVRGQDATVTAQRSDTIDAGGRRQTVQSRQTFQLARSGGGWVITDIR